MSIPLVQKAEKDDINTSIIAIKRNIERINMLLGLVDSGGSDPDLSGLATKQELQDAVESLQPVDEVTVGNMHSVTSNAVANMGVEVTGWSTTSGYGFVGCVTKIGRVVSIFGRAIGSTGGSVILTGLPPNRGSEVQSVPSAINMDYYSVAHSGVIGIEHNSSNLIVHTGDYSNKQLNIALVYLTD